MDANTYPKGTINTLTPMNCVLPRDIRESDVICIAKDLCGILVKNQKNGIVHGRINPQNIYITKDGSYVLGDIRIGMNDPADKFAAPEVCLNQAPGAASDIYSLGLVLYWLMNDRRMPFLPLPPEIPSSQAQEEAGKRRLRGDPLPAPAHGSAALQAIVRKACFFRPEDRYSTGEDMLAALSTLSESAEIYLYPLAAAKQTPPVRPISPAQRPQSTAQPQSFASPTAYAPPAMPGYGARQTPQKKKGNSLIYIILASVGGAALIGIALLLLLPKMSREQSEKLEAPTVVTTEEIVTTVMETEPLETEPSPYMDVTFDSDYVDFKIPACGYIIEDSGYRRISEYELVDMTEHECSIARNEIYARHGRRFKSEKVQDYFDHMPWYYGYIEPDEFDRNIKAYLTQVEIDNVFTISSFEDKKGW